MSDTLSDVLKRHFTRETGLYITSEEHNTNPESNEKDWCEFFDGDVGEFLDSDDMKEFRDLDSVLDCEITFSGTDCLIYVTVFDNVFDDGGDDETD